MSKVNAVNLTEKEYLLPGNRLCPGCAVSLAYRHILKALEGQAVVTVPASCLTVLHGMYPVTSVTVPVREHAVCLYGGVCCWLGGRVESAGEDRPDGSGHRR